MNCVNWYEAFAFCGWDGAYLPTEAEWNYAAAGGGQQRTYPWTTPPSAPEILLNDASFGCDGDGVAGCSFADLIFVGTKPDGAGRWGQLDLTGNVSEWVLDVYASYATPCVNCAHLGPETSRVYRGGDYSSYGVPLQTDRRGTGESPTHRSETLGARCARSP
jgi:formylglycine-generating enzyme required for sulfatase activity